MRVVLEAITRTLCARLLRSLTFCACALGASLALAKPAEQISVEVTADGGRDMARQALQMGNPDLAVRIARQVLAAYPEDIGSLVLLTTGLAQLGHGAEGAIYGRQAFGLAKTPAEHFQAAYVTAAALSAADQPYTAKFWLRRANNYSATTEDTTLLAKAFQKLDARTPVKLTLSIGGGPSDNVNGGSLHDSFDFFGILIPISQALPGTTLSTVATLSYRLVSTPTLGVSVYAVGAQRNVWLSPQAYELQPGARNSEFRYNGLDLGSYVGWAVSDKTVLNMDLQVGKTWQGGILQSDHERVTFGISQTLIPTRIVNLAVTAEKTHYPSTPHANSLRLAADSSLALTLARSTLRYNLGVAQVDAEAAGVAYRATLVGVNWQPNQDFHGVTFDLFGRSETRHYWKTPGFAPDVLNEAGVTAEFTKLAVFGFSPTLTLSAARSKSPVVVRDTSSVGITVGFGSTF